MSDLVGAHERQYTMLRNCVEVDQDAVAWFNRLKRMKARWGGVFNDDLTDHRASLRLSTKIALADLPKHFKTAVQRVTAAICSVLQVETGQWVVLWSKANRPQQLMHLDFNDTDIETQVESHGVAAYPYSLLLSFADNAGIAFENGVTETYHVGDIVIFRGDTAHAGTACEEEHYGRLHCYLCSEHVPCPINRSYIL